jgi:hypothetical protein
MGGPRAFAPSFGGAHIGSFHDGRFHGGHFRDGRSFHDGRFHHRRAFFFAPAFAYYDYGYGYGGCYWLWRNAVATGSPYWWSRYNACVYGY